MFQRKCGLAFAAITCMVLGVCFLANTDTASGQLPKKVTKVDKAKLKIIISKTDPEIKAAQSALQTARKDLLKARSFLVKAMNDEVFGEKGATEAASIDRLKLALKACDGAIADVNQSIKMANLAQLVDKGGD